MGKLAQARTLAEAVDQSQPAQATLQQVLARHHPRYLKAEIIKHSSHVKMDLPSGWNKAHLPYDFQLDDAAWHVVSQRGMNASKTGLGKTITLLLSAQIRKAMGRPFRTLVLCHETQVMRQWFEAVEKFTDLYPAMMGNVGSDGQFYKYTAAARQRTLAGNWDVCISTYPLLRQDFAFIRRLHFDCIFLDEASMFRNHDTQTAQYVKALAFGREVIHPADATPIQIQLQDMHSIMESLHENVFPPLPAFQREFVRFEDSRIRLRGKKRFISKKRIVGYKNIDLFKVMIEPFYVRRTKDDPKVVREARMPKVVVLDRYVELLPRQRAMYERIRKGVVDKWDAGQRREAKSSYQDLLKACDSTALFNDPNPESAKIDWVLRHLRPGGDLADEKMLMFCDFIDYVDEVHHNLTREGIKSARWTGHPDHKKERESAFHRFWNEPDLRAIIGTTALERGGNWQCANYLINLSLLWNPKRVEQLIGRIERLFSDHTHVFLVNVLAANTVEQRIMNVLARRSAVADVVFEEVSELFEALPEDELFELIRG